MFSVITPENCDSFELKHYLIYQDIVYHGTEHEKNLLSFRILDLSGTGKVHYETYESFWLQFLSMYGEMFNYKINLDDNAKQAAKVAFDILSDGNDFFDFEMFESAKESNPLLLEWLDEPESMMKQSQN